MQGEVGRVYVSITVITKDLDNYLPSDINLDSNLTVGATDLHLPAADSI